MRKLIFFIVIAISINSCSSCSDEKSKETKTKTNDPYHLTENDSVFRVFQEGVPQTVKTFKYEDGKVVFTYEREYYRSGQIRMEGPLMNGRREGLWKSYYEDGKVWSEDEYRNGIRDGKTVTYYENGAKRFEGTFRMSKKTGEWKFYNEQGAFVKKMNFDKPVSGNK